MVTIIPTPSNPAFIGATNTITDFAKNTTPCVFKNPQPAYDADHPCRISHNLTIEIRIIQKTFANKAMPLS